MINSEIKGNVLVITVALDKPRTQSKSALAKALEKGLDADKVPANMVATTGGFTKTGNVKFSLNVME